MKPGAPLRIVLLAAFVATSCGTPPGGAPENHDAAALLQQVGEDLLRHREERHLYYAFLAGRAIEHLPRFTPEAYREEEETLRRLLARLDAVTAEDLTSRDRLILAALRWDLARDVEHAHDWPKFRFHATPRVIRQHYFRALFADYRLDTDAHGERYLRLLDQAPTFIDDIRESYRRQAAQGIFMPPDAVDLTLPLWRTFHGGMDGGNGPSLFHLDAERVASLDGGGEALRAEVARRVDAAVRPAIERLVEYLDGEYRQAAPEALGFAHVPGGEAYYRHRVRWATTLDVEPEELHRRGQEQLRQLEEQLAGIRRSLGFSGTREEFNRQLQEDDRFYPRTPEEVGERLRACLAKIEPRVDEYFLRRPQAPYDVRRLPPVLEGSLTWGYYEPPNTQEPAGVYYFNGSNLRERTLIHACHLIYHELVPGHHFQVALQAENLDIPAYRRESYYVAHAEGWAVYASYLGEEMGLYDDPYSLYGALTGRMFYAARLLADTGLNHLGWTREQAAETMRSNTLMSETQIRTELLRYGVDTPGQALGYAVGAAKFLEWRRRAEDELGEDFDVRRFHAAILDAGALPLQVLDGYVDEFIAGEKKR